MKPENYEAKPSRAPFSKTTIAAIFGLIGAASLASPASAQERSLRDYVQAAERFAPDVREARLNAEIANSQVDEARARFLPSLVGQAAYQRNEFQVQFQIPGSPNLATIQLYDQLSASGQLNVPLIDVGAWLAYTQAEAAAGATTIRAEARRIDVAVSASTTYVQMRATQALRMAAQRALDVANANLEIIQARYDAGLVTDVDLGRAQSDAARAQQNVADADLQAVQAIRNLSVLSGIVLPLTGGAIDGDAPSSEFRADPIQLPALETFTQNLSHLPSLRAAREGVVAAQRGQDAAWASLFPTIAGAATERYTNASGFAPQAQWALVLQATWQLDFLKPAQIGTRSRQRELSEVQLERARLDAETAIVDAWNRVRTASAAIASARAAEEATNRAAVAARARLQSGLGTQLELSQAERDLFQAQASRIQAEGTARAAFITLQLRSRGTEALDELLAGNL